MFENGFLLQTFLPQEKPYEISFRIKINDMNQSRGLIDELIF